MSQASNDFSERVMRINAGALNTRHTLFVGMDEAFNVPERSRTVPVAPGSSLSTAFLLGVVGAGASIMLAFHLFGLTEPLSFARDALLVQATLGLAIAYTLGWILRQRTVVQRIAQSVGVVSMLWLLPMAAQMWPAPFAAAMSPDLLSSVWGALPDEVGGFLRL